jgi:hypothetical protein
MRRVLAALAVLLLTGVVVGGCHDVLSVLDGIATALGEEDGGTQPGTIRQPPSTDEKKPSDTHTDVAPPPATQQPGLVYVESCDEDPVTVRHDKCESSYTNCNTNQLLWCKYQKKPEKSSECKQAAEAHCKSAREDCYKTTPLHGCSAGKTCKNHECH